jgi:hypothetical protein
MARVLLTEVVFYVKLIVNVMSCSLLETAAAAVWAGIQDHRKLQIAVPAYSGK